MCVFVASALAGVARAESEPGSNSDWGLTQIVDQKVSDSKIVSADQELASAWQARSHQWLAGAPQIFGSYRSDSFDSGRDGSESEAGVSVPLSTRRSRRAAKEVAANVKLRAENYEAQLRLQWAGRLREAYWDTRAAEVRAESAKLALEETQKLHQATVRRVELGDAARNASLLTQRTVAAAESDRVIAEESLLQAERYWVALSGLAQLPSWSPEKPAQKEKDHPAVRGLELEIQRLQAEQLWVQADVANAPRLGVSWFREQGVAANSRQDSTIVSLALPFGQKRFLRPEVADLTAQLARAEWARDQTLMQLKVEQNAAESGLQAAKTKRAHLLNASTASQRYAQQLLRAQELGEANLRDVIRAAEQARDDQTRARLAEIELARSVARFNQSLGVIQ